MQDINDVRTQSYFMIRRVGSYVKQVQDQDLKSILERHLPCFLEWYNEVVSFQEGEEIQQVVCNRPPSALASMTEEEMAEEDIAIASYYLTNVKRLAIVYAQAAVEVANPQLRQFLENNFLAANRYAYEVWQYMVKCGTVHFDRKDYKEAK
ncbi:spore coat protein [Microbacteriaceae bacterium 4G12]